MHPADPAGHIHTAHLCCTTQLLACTIMFCAKAAPKQPHPSPWLCLWAAYSCCRAHGVCGGATCGWLGLGQQLVADLEDASLGRFALSSKLAHQALAILNFNHLLPT